MIKNIKKLSALLLSVLILSTNVYAQKITYFEESEDFSVEDFLNGEPMPITEIIKFPQTKSRSAVLATEEMYSQLDDIEKEVYDSLEANIESTKDGTSTIRISLTIPLTAGYDVYDDDDYDSFYAEIVDYFNNSNINYNFTRGVYALIVYDHPEYFWIDINKLAVGISIKKSGYDKETGEYTTALIFMPYTENYDNYYPDCYTDSSEVQADIDACDSVVDNIISTFPEGASDYYKMQIINEWLLANNSYNAYVDDEDTISYYAYIAPSALLYGNGDDKTKYPVCEGYAEAFKIICDKADIPCVCGIAFGTDDVGHKWNLVKLDDIWYYYDATWNDSNNRSSIYYKDMYFAIGSDTMSSYDSKNYHNLDTDQFSFKLFTPSTTNFLDDRGLADVSTLDVKGDNYINNVDCAAALKLIMTDSLTADINNDGEYNLVDAVDYLKLMFD